MADRYIDEHNNTPIPDFEGLTPSEMHQLLYGELQDCVIQVSDRASAVDEIPLARLIAALLSEIPQQSGLKLTSAGYLPPKTVKVLYGLQILTDEDIEFGISKLTSESDSLIIHTARIIAELAGYLRKRRGRLELTKKGAEIRSTTNLSSTLVTTFAHKYNFAYSDGYVSEQIGQFGYRFSLYLLKKYGGQRRPAAFYADRYFRAFPFLSTGDAADIDCYRLRTFDRFTSYFGFTTAVGREDGSVATTRLFDDYIVYNPKLPVPSIGGRRIVRDMGDARN